MGGRIAALHYLGFVGGLWFAAFVLGAPRVVSEGSVDMVAAGWLAVVAGFGVACCVVATGRVRAARLEVLALAGALPLWLSVRICLGLILPGEWEAVLLPVSLLLVLAIALILVPFLLVAQVVRASEAHAH